MLFNDLGGSLQLRDYSSHLKVAHLREGDLGLIAGRIHAMMIDKETHAVINLILNSSYKSICKDTSALSLQCTSICS